jgi:hypothetical protein
MRWPFRVKSRESGSVEPTEIGEAAPAYAASAPRAEWASLPPAPIAIAVRAPRTIGGTTSAIRRPIGLRELADVTDDAAVGVVDGIVGVMPAAPRASVRPDAPVGEASALPDIGARVLHRVDAAGRVVLMTSESVVVRAPTPAPTTAGSSEPHLARTRDDTLDNELPQAPRSSLAQSRRMGLGPGYHGPLPDAIRRDRLDRGADADGERDDTAEGAGATERVPDDLRTIIRDAYGHDVGDEVVHRGPEVSDEARRLGAQAFARDGSVFVPIERGPLDRPEAKSLLAHELTHLVQARRRIAPLPADGSPEALVLEAEAQRAERFVRGDAGAPRPGPTANADATAGDTADTQRFVQELVHRGVAEPDGTGGIRFLWGHGAGGRVQRATEPAGTAARAENWNPAASVAHSIGETVIGEFEDMLVGEFSFVTGFEDEVTKAHDTREREYRQAQTREAFGRLRLEHLRVTKRSETGGVELTDSQENELRRAVADEVLRRDVAFDQRVKAHLDQVNEQLRNANQTEQRELDPEKVDAIFDKLFGQPDSEFPADDPPADLKEHADKAVEKATAKAEAKAKAQALGTGAPTGGAPSGTPAGMPGRPPGTPAMGATSSGVIDSASALWGALVTDLAVIEAGEFGITLTDDELKGLSTPDPATKPTPAKSSDASQPPAPGAPPTATTTPIPRDTKHIGPSGHEKIDLDCIDFEELSKRLFPRLRSSLRQELLVDRERSGRLNHH